MDRKVAQRLEHWQAAGIIDPATTERIRAWEVVHTASHGSRLGRLAFGFGGSLLGAGILLFVAANWDRLSPWGRYALLAATVAAIHVIAGIVRDRSAALATTLHAVGTAAFGAGVFLAGQSFNLAEQWPEGFLLWAVGAACALWWLRDWPHVLYVAALVPAWLITAWAARIGIDSHGGFTVPVVGTFVLGVAYLSCVDEGRGTAWRQALARLGAVAVLLAGATLPFAASDPDTFFIRAGAQIPPSWRVLGWGIAGLGPLALGGWLRGREAWPLLVALPFALVVTAIDASTAAERSTVHLLYLCAAVGLAWWGVRDAHRLRVNVGVVAFALVVLWFYFGSVFDKFGRSLGLIALGVLFIGGGWLLERARRTLLSRIDEARP
jgi:uncharacterized membrane protein